MVQAFTRDSIYPGTTSTPKCAPDYPFSSLPPHSSSLGLQEFGSSTTRDLLRRVASRPRHLGRRTRGGQPSIHFLPFWTVSHSSTWSASVSQSNPPHSSGISILPPFHGLLTSLEPIPLSSPFPSITIPSFLSSCHSNSTISPPPRPRRFAHSCSYRSLSITGSALVFTQPSQHQVFDIGGFYHVVIDMTARPLIWASVFNMTSVPSALNTSGMGSRMTVAPPQWQSHLVGASTNCSRRDQLERLACEG
ncbi:hypothetical protein K474DRAFT_1362992 [Panus rudis PR-1116 ss-1]|nr:hypothetical protein K474DRAFT_1362992 [Panus rudis PR-1116 ss-1]